MVVCALLVAAVAPAARAQATVTFEQMVAELGNDDPGTRLRAVQALKLSAYPEAAVPLTRSLADGEDLIQLEAIAAELNIFLTERIVTRKRVAMVVEVRNRISALSAFELGRGGIDPRPVPLEVLTALRTASHDDNPRVSVEALYAFGALADNAYGADRAALLTASAAELAATLGVPQPDLRSAAVRVIARLYAWRAGDPGIDQTLGDALVTALNDREGVIRASALDAIGVLRYERGLQAATDLYEHYQRGSTAVAALRAVARIAHPSSVPLFTAALTSKDALVRAAAVEGLARTGQTAQAQTISTALATEKNEDLLLAGQLASVLLTNGPIDTLVGGLTRPKLADRARQYLIDVTPGRTGLLSPQLSDPEPSVRAALLDVLGQAGDPAGLSLAQRLTADTDPLVARAAARAVASLEATHTPRP
jgi:hypothetical protein